MINKQFRVIILSLFWIHLSAQTVGNPIGTSGQNRWTLAASTNFSHIQTNTQVSILNKHLAKLIWGAFPYWDIYILGGGSKLHVNLPREDFKGKYRFSYGLGTQWMFNLSPKKNEIQLFFNIMALCFKSEQVINRVTNNNIIVNELNYDWREVQGYVGLSYHYKRVIMYGAVNGMLIQRLDKRREFWNAKWTNWDKATYQSGLWIGGAIGLEILLPSQYSISLETLVFNRENYQIMVGIAQTKLPGW